MKIINIPINTDLINMVKNHLQEDRQSLDNHIQQLICSDLIKKEEITQSEADKFMHENTFMSISVIIPRDLNQKLKVYLADIHKTKPEYIAELISKDFPRLKQEGFNCNASNCFYNNIDYTKSTMQIPRDIVFKANYLLKSTTQRSLYIAHLIEKDLHQNLNFNNINQGVNSEEELKDTDENMNMTIG